MLAQYDDFVFAGSEVKYVFEKKKVEWRNDLENRKISKCCPGLSRAKYLRKCVPVSDCLLQLSELVLIILYFSLKSWRLYIPSGQIGSFSLFDCLPRARQGNQRKLRRLCRPPFILKHFDNFQ